MANGDDAAAIIFFDGVCNLCDASVQFLIQRDPRGHFRFAALQSAAAERLLAAHRPDPSDSVALLEDGRFYTRSSAALRIVRRLRFPWPILYLIVVIPRPLRDRLYDFVARHRYRWFGRKEFCLPPTPEHRARFIS